MVANEHKYIEEMVRDMEKHNKGLLHEYYIAANNKQDRYILKDLKIYIYNLDREQMTPHCHVKSGDGEVELEVSLLDWSIVNVKTPQGLSNNWSNFRDIKDRFFEWLDVYHKKTDLLNVYWLFELWDGENPNNALEAYKDNSNINEYLKEYLQKDQYYIDKDSLQKDLYATLVPLFLNKTVPKLDDPINLLKEIGLFKKHPVQEDDKEMKDMISKTYNQLKAWGF